ncbi:MAG: hypothetical protein BWX88_01394 [Planctomycetes bacterium ADurb.Bin126]|nr:MAG: hypothetical protein BWX88_01394 [Planctomycetes bacterium ADurb.Bin126]
MSGRVSRLGGGRLQPAIAGLAAWVGVVFTCVLHYGWPANVGTYSALAGGLAFVAMAVLARGRCSRWVWWGGFILHNFFLLVPMETASLLDFGTGRKGVSASLYLFDTHVLLYRKDGPNTRLLRRLGTDREARWRFAATRTDTFGFGSWRDGFDVTVEFALIGQPHLGPVLARVPDDPARRQVLICLCDPENCARVYQEMLLVMLWEYGYPPGLDAQSWWARHAEIFRTHPDPEATARLVDGLADHFRKVLEERPAKQPEVDLAWAVLNSQGGVVGGDHRLSVALKAIYGQPLAADAWVNRIAWWAAATPAVSTTTSAPHLGTGP